ncbi:hypothetical protein NIES4074_00810 [Cylindrospermum sp. NIES-4074]|nr:hypothetical protein NIES4074_00810 [Cylindrospermum sp. NIES-4074]
MIDVVWDMETSDPDDFLTLLFLIGHPLVNLKAVTVTPGTPAQIGLVRHALTQWFGLNIPVESHDLEHAFIGQERKKFPLLIFLSLPSSLRQPPSLAVLDSLPEIL